MIRQSLKLRLFLAALLFIGGALLLYWIALTWIFEQRMLERLHGELEAHLNQLAIELSVSDDGSLAIESQPANPRFDRPFGGLYWQAESEGAETLVSRSLWDQTLTVPPLPDLPSGKLGRHTLVDSGAGPLIALERTVFLTVGEERRTVRLIAAMDRGDLDAASTAFSRQTALLVALLAAFLLAAAALQIVIGLKPLGALRERIADLSSSREPELTGDHPAEVQPLVDALNALLQERAEMVERARASASNLAHGLKTPLAILSAEARSLTEAGNAEAARELEHQIAAMNRQIERQLARARVRGPGGQAGGGTELKPALEKLVNAFRHMPRGEEIEWTVECEEDLTANIDSVDFEEVAGNLLDNARKWTKDTVTIRVREEDGTIRLTIADNGPGIPEGAHETILTPGTRADDSTPGSGLGLAIALDVLGVYGGGLELRDADGGGLRVEVMVPAGQS